MEGDYVAFELYACVCVCVCERERERSGVEKMSHVCCMFNLEAIPDRKKTIAMELQMANQWICVSLICR